MEDLKQDVEIRGGHRVPAWELVESFSTSQGPGGQNVNKVATAVELRWNLPASSLEAGVKARLERALRTRLTKEGDLILNVSETRSQLQNRLRARTRLKELLDRALTPRKRRIATRPTRGSVERRLKAKARRSEVKAGRGKVTGED